MQVESISTIYKQQIDDLGAIWAHKSKFIFLDINLLILDHSRNDEIDTLPYVQTHTLQSNFFPMFRISNKLELYDFVIIFPSS